MREAPTQIQPEILSCSPSTMPRGLPGRGGGGELVFLGSLGHWALGRRMQSAQRDSGGGSTFKGGAWGTQGSPPAPCSRPPTPRVSMTTALRAGARRPLCAAGSPPVTLPAPPGAPEDTLGSPPPRAPAPAHRLVGNNPEIWGPASHLLGGNRASTISGGYLGVP